MKDKWKNFRNGKGITLIALVVTIVVLLILAGITMIALTGQNGILNKSKEAEEENDKKTATEILNLKITSAQMASYTEKQQMPTLAYLAAYLEEDKTKTGDIEYVNSASKRVATINESDYEGWDRIYTKLSKYPYEFEINSNLQLASIDGVKIANTQDDYEKLKEEINKLKTDIVNLNEQVTLLQNDNSAETMYKPGDSITIAQAFYSGFISASAKEIYFSIPLGKDISPEVSNITVSSGDFRMRGVSGYIIQSILNNLGDYFNLLNFDKNIICLKYTSSSTLSEKNNTPVSMDIKDLIINFN